MASYARTTEATAMVASLTAVPVLFAMLALTKAAADSGEGITPLSRPGGATTSARELEAVEVAAVLTETALMASHPPEPHPPSLRIIDECPASGKKFWLRRKI
eukprot:CAMPEP_0172198874 /NCGR_PEP_ID=MMETSP1050-20130122/28348_1 /TAXON_ID=233186 /ORGANISM="Cryptomonas curvata, Strain CCAP979/52" /LENGTH=102 /DNA_ID=CAMNT_0012875781 /DNA_START=36 /DNA_END=341 /DNA_ORIENTATION=-